MTKEEILSNKEKIIGLNIPYKDRILEAMQEYSDIQNAALIERVKELEDSILLALDLGNTGEDARDIKKILNNLLTKHK